jgi:hypothetical protein
MAILSVKVVKKNEITNPAELDKSLIAGIIYANPAKPEDARDLFRQPQRGRDIFFLLLYNKEISEYTGLKK